MVRSLRRGATAALATAVLLVPSLAAAQSGSNPSGSNTSGSNTTGTNTTGTNTTGTNTAGPNTAGPNQPTTPNAPSTSSRTLAQLEREALRLTLIARLPAADRPQAGQLLDRADALRQRATDMRRQELQAYVDALQAGATPTDARTQAQKKVAGERSSLAQDEATLRTDAQTFVQKVPQARALLRNLSPGRSARTQTLGRGFGSGQGWGQGRSMGQGMNRKGMDRGWMGPDRNAPWQRPGTGPRNSPPQNGTPPTTPRSTPPSSTPPAGTGTGGA